MFPCTTTPSFYPKNPVDMFPTTTLNYKTSILSHRYVSTHISNSLNKQLQPFKLLVQVTIPDGKTLKSAYISAFPVLIQKLHVTSRPHTQRDRVRTICTYFLCFLIQGIPLFFVYENILKCTSNTVISACSSLI